MKRLIRLFLFTDPVIFGQPAKSFRALVLSAAACLCLILLSACSALVSGPTAVPSLTPSPTATEVPPSPTPTVVWFPVAPTFTPFPTPQITPTAQMLTGLGTVLLEDTFGDGEAWQLSANIAGTVALGKNALSVVIREPGVYLSSLRAEPVLDNFYLEITARPTFCQENDEYGLLFRVSPYNDLYRFSLTCGGQVRLERVVGGRVSSPQPWIYTGAVPPGAPNKARLSVWALDGEMRFFINSQYQFTVTDSSLASGQIGVFARSTTEKDVTINFSELIIRELER